VECKPLMAVEPLADLRMLVRRVVVEDHMNCLARRNFGEERIPRRLRRSTSFVGVGARVEQSIK
jgi:hypothetical protein